MTDPHPPRLGRCTRWPGKILAGLPREPADRWLLVFVALWSISLLAYINGNDRLQSFDASMHLNFQWDLALFSRARWPVEGIAGVVKLWVRSLAMAGQYTNNWPELSYLVTFLVGLFTGLSAKTPLYANLVWAWLALYSVYRLAQAAGGRWAGRLAVIGLATYAGFLGAAHLYFIDFPLAAMTAYGLWRLYLCQGFTRWRPSLWFGLLSAAGMLLKGQYLMIMVGPAAVAFAVGLYRAYAGKPAAVDAGATPPGPGKIALIGLAVVLPILATAAYWVGARWEFLYTEVLAHIVASWRGQAAAGVLAYDTGLTLQDPGWWLFYPGVLVYFALPVHLLLGAIAIGGLLRARNKSLLNAALGLALLMFIHQYGLHTMVSSKVARYFIPAFAPLAVVLAVGLAQYQKTAGRLIIASLFGLAWAFNTWLSVDIDGYHHYRGWGLDVFGQYMADPWLRPMDEDYCPGCTIQLLDFVRKSGELHQPPRVAFVVAPQRPLTWWPWEYSRYLELRFKEGMYPAEKYYSKPPPPAMPQDDFPAWLRPAESIHGHHDPYPPLLNPPPFDVLVVIFLGDFKPDDPSLAAGNRDLADKFGRPIPQYLAARDPGELLAMQRRGEFPACWRLVGQWRFPYRQFHIDFPNSMLIYRWAGPGTAYCR